MISKIKLLYVNSNVVNNDKDICVNDFGSYAHAYIHTHVHCQYWHCSVLHFNKRGVKYEVFQLYRKFQYK